MDLIRSLLLLPHRLTPSAPQNPRKPNQDALLMKHCLPSSSLVIACFDGHGQYGHLISRFCKSYMEAELPLHKHFVSNLGAAIVDVTQALGRTHT